MNADQELLVLKNGINDKLDRLLADSSELPFTELFSAARYSTLAPGKRLRPTLMCVVATGYGASLEEALLPACAIEMIHAYSLIHDDLPCMDDDAMRRGLPTLHKVYPEWHALLTGDFLLTFAFEVIATAPLLSADQKVQLITSLAKHSGAHGMIGGQMIDLLSVGKAIDYPTLERMHRLKTASLIIAAIEMGAIVGGAPKSDLAHLTSAAENVGIAFQLIDDVLDDEGSELELGKPIGSDEQNEKATAIGLMGNRTAKETAQKMLQQAHHSLESLSRPIPLLEHIFHQMINRNK